MKRKYVDHYSNFDINEFNKFFDGDINNSINAAVECCDRYADSDKVALYWEGVNGEEEVITFKKLKDETSRLANFLVAQGVKPGEVISGLLPRTPELLYTILGAWKAGVIYQPLFTAFGPKAIEQRLNSSQAKIVFTDDTNRAKLDELPMKPKKCVLVRSNDYQLAQDDFDFHKAMTEQSVDFTPVMKKGEDTFCLLSTSGTTGLPKAVPVPLFALSSFKQYMDLAVDLKPTDRFWNLADPGWAYGLYYSVIGPLVNGNALLFYEGGFSTESTVRVIQKYKVTNLAGSPTAFRLLIGNGDEVSKAIKGQLRVVSSAGEPLNPEVINWFKNKLDVVINDHYGQTETGMTVNNHHELEHEIKPGSMGYAMPGYKVVILDENGKVAPPNTPGVIAVDIANSPIMWFKGYLKAETPAIANGFYTTGDTAEQTEDGRITYVGRNDDVITSSGYRIGPFDVESVLLEHPCVLETAVIGKPDPKRTEIVKAFVVLNKGFEASEELKEELSLFVKKGLAAHAYPREIEFIEELPKTPSGKVQRFLLKRRED
ncbi:AMP-binding protein [Halobacteriovorax sp. HFRX-1_3]|uniref:AMP-binding protein n=3 Tax=unclassified Halobacteriovorax TaxID=2639665 RepID=UPI003719CDCB